MPRKPITYQEFVEEAMNMKFHKDSTGKHRYIYCLASFVNTITPMKILCLTCMVIFNQTPQNHTKRHKGCKECTGKIKTTEQFIKKAKCMNKHKDEKGNHRYSYDKTVFKKANEKVIIFCKTCSNNFFVSPIMFIRKGRGCQKCTMIQKVTNQEQFMQKVLNMDVHKTKSGEHKYDYTNAIFTHSRGLVIIFCKCCSKNFNIMAYYHLRGRGCFDCGHKQVTTKTFIEKSMKILKHKDSEGNHNYLYDKVVFKSWNDKVTIFCKGCNKYIQNSPRGHLKGRGCFDCFGPGKKNLAYFIKKSISVHLDENGNYKYGYDKAIYVDAQTNVTLTCLKCDTDFECNPIKHYNGSGCPVCILSKGEEAILRYLNKNHIPYERQKRFSNCKDKKTLPFDFEIAGKYLIEFDGEQHFKDVNFFPGFESRKKRDEIKDIWCNNNQKYLLRISYRQMRKIKIIMDKFLEVANTNAADYLYCSNDIDYKDRSKFLKINL